MTKQFLHESSIVTAGRFCGGSADLRRNHRCDAVLLAQGAMMGLAVVSCIGNAALDAHTWGTLV